MSKLLLLLAWCIMLFGCGTPAPNPRPVNLILNANQNLGSSTVRVDVIGVNSTDQNSLSGYPVDAYFNPANPLRQSLNKKTFVFGEGQPASYVLPMDDPVWGQWMDRGAENLLIIADLPGIFKEGSDMRRVVLPLDEYRWPNGWFWRTTTIQLEIQAPLIQLETAMLPQPGGN